MATTLEEIRAGITANIKAALPDVQMTGYVLAKPTPPAFDVELDPEGVSYDQSFNRGIDEWFLIVRGFVNLNLDISSQKQLDAWIASSGPRSVKAALEADTTLGGAVDDLHVTQVGGYRKISVGNQPISEYLGAEWRVRILATGA